MNACYFDTSVFLAIFNGEPTGPGIRALLRELKSNKTKVYTSILTIQEASVMALRSGARADEIHTQIGKFARIQTLTREIAVTAAQLEALVLDKMKAADLAEEDRIGINRRRKWDCIHIATALDLCCSTMYCLDDRMINRRLHLDLKGLDVLEPLPRAMNLFTEIDPSTTIQ